MFSPAAAGKHGRSRYERTPLFSSKGDRMAKKKNDEQGEPTFEDRLARLEAIVTRLESAEVGLDESLKLYAEGAGLIKECRKTLTEAEKKIAKLTQDASGELKTEPFEPEEGGEAADKDK